MNKYINKYIYKYTHASLSLLLSAEVELKLCHTLFKRLLYFQLQGVRRPHSALCVCVCVCVRLMTAD